MTYTTTLISSKKTKQREIINHQHLAVLKKDSIKNNFHLKMMLHTFYPHPTPRIPHVVVLFSYRFSRTSVQTRHMQITITYCHVDSFLLHAHSVEKPPCMAAREMTHSCLVCVSHRTFHHRATSQLPASACRGSSSVSGRPGVALNC